MAIREDEIQLVKTILKYCKKPYDTLPRDEIDKLNMNEKRLMYLLHKMTHFINYGVGVYWGWICEEPSYIINYYKNTHGIDLNENN